jgi:hypothetical protein
MEAAGLAIGVVSLLAGFKGAIDGYLLIRSIFDEDNGLRDLALDYKLACHCLEAWGDRFKVKAPREEDCLLYRENDATKGLMAELLGRVLKLQSDAAKFLDFHGAKDYKVDFTKLSKSLPPVSRYFHLQSPLIEAVSKEQMAKKQSHQIKWAIKNKAALKEIVDKLRQANKDLDMLLSDESRAAASKAVPAYYLAAINSVSYLQQVHNAGFLGNDLIRQGAQLKLLQSSTNGSQATQPTTIRYEDLQALGTSSTYTGCRDVYVHNGVTRSWVDWLEIERTLTPVKDMHVRQRIKTLSAMLERTPDQFQVAKCIGYTEDPANAFRTGLVYRIPQEYSRAKPVSLLSMIEQCENKTLKEPPLGDKFKLAHMLATTLMQLHTSNWLHKGFRGDNILFFTQGIARPYLAGFEYARDVNMQSIGNRPTGKNSKDYYYHPDVVHGFTKSLDLYSMGVVLLEIAYWRRLGRKAADSGATTLEAIREIFLKSAGSRLDAVVGTIYADVVRRCLNCSLQELSDEAEFACAMNTEIVMALEGCRA